MKKSIDGLMEKLWFVIMIICFGLALHQTYMIGIKKSYMFFILAGMAFLLYYVRRKRRETHPEE